MIKLAIVCHDQSQWNLKNQFTKWVGVDLSERGGDEEKLAAATHEVANQTKT